jgi:hypothetical protein
MQGPMWLYANSLFRLCLGFVQNTNSITHESAIQVGQICSHEVSTILQSGKIFRCITENVEDLAEERKNRGPRGLPARWYISRRDQRVSSRRSQ